MRGLRLLGLSLLTGAALAGGAGAPPTAPLQAIATLRDEAGQVLGTASFTSAANGVRVSVEVRGLPAGMHGMHVHEYGRCTPGVDPATNTIVPFGGAGGHFDPGMSANHDSPTAGNRDGHAGDLPMLTVGADGVGRATFTSDKIALSGMNGVLRRSLVVHARPDDYKTDPSGMTGARLRCGVIQRVNVAGLAPRDYTLPDPQAFPEGVAYDARRGLIFTGSLVNGAVYAINAATGAVNLFSPGGALGRKSVLGLKVDARSRLWIAGGAQGSVSVLSPDGFPVAVLMTPDSPNPFINDLALSADGGAYVTDSFRPAIYRVSPDLKISRWLDLTRTPLRYQEGFNLNGIVLTSDERFLLAVQLNTGDLWRIDTRTQAVRRVMGGLTGGDGLLLDGRTLYVARNTVGVVSKVALTADYASGQLVADEPVTGLRFPTTLAAIGNDLVVTQSQLDKLMGGTPETPFQLTRFRKF